VVDLFKELLPSILSTKAAVISAENEKEYPAFMVNRALSFHMDCILHANQMNIYHDLDNIMQHDYLLNIIRSKFRRFQKWQKLDKIADLEVVKEYYNFSTEKAKEAYRLLTDEQMTEIKARLYKGGLNDKSKRTNRGEA